jgi:hypothetical protein
LPLQRSFECPHRVLEENPLSRHFEMVHACMIGRYQLTFRMARYMYACWTAPMKAASHSLQYHQERGLCDSGGDRGRLCLACPCGAGMLVCVVRCVMCAVVHTFAIDSDNKATVSSGTSAHGNVLPHGWWLGCHATNTMHGVLHDGLSFKRPNHPITTSRPVVTKLALPPMVTSRRASTARKACPPLFVGISRGTASGPAAPVPAAAN